MAIIGLRVHSWFGWLTGVLLIDLPSGPPTLKSWFSLHNLWSLIVIIIQHTLLIDFLRQSSIILSLGVNKLARDLHTFMFVVAYLAFWSIRIIFAVYAKKLAVLLNRLYFYPLKSQIVIWQSAWRKAQFVINLSALLAFSLATIFTCAIHFREAFAPKKSSWFSWAGSVGSALIGTAFGSLTTMYATNLAFAIIVSVSFYLAMIFDEFCDDIEALLRTSSMWFANDFKIIKRQKESTIIRISSTREVLIKKLEYIQEIFDSADEIISPLVLIVFVAETFRLVTGAHELIINRLGGLFAVHGYLTIFEQFVHTCLVLVGSFVKDNVRNPKH